MRLVHGHQHRTRDAIEASVQIAHHPRGNVDLGPVGANDCDLALVAMGEGVEVYRVETGRSFHSFEPLAVQGATVLAEGLNKARRTPFLF